jgi:hypothetical protein
MAMFAMAKAASETAGEVVVRMTPRCWGLLSCKSAEQQESHVDPGGATCRQRNSLAGIRCYGASRAGLPNDEVTLQGGCNVGEGQP